ncbi:ChuX/HutX family heme-like substrate-binding protein [Aquisalimonas lutea]|uniref:ChuX/HutX family heme-like substrate-binding protein n=1 Tax=Aquisalimonas lutea TaxID=1327750 RepID=UPI0025B45066|nr:ChuX/HutX family heme-like substrate-binding protein [Aquisalimonas lutea]MDN3518091.1 ChuX/HutX family heme-like substrate-binding protein [Aquisalimonas lutea]
MGRSLRLTQETARGMHRAWRQILVHGPAATREARRQPEATCELTALLAEPPSRVRRLVPEFPALYAHLAGVGPVETLTTNPVAMHRIRGAAGALRFQAQSQTGACSGALDLRMFFNAWAHGCAVVEPVSECSLRFFDEHGRFLHAVYPTPETNMDAWYELVVRYAADEQRPFLDVARRPFGGVTDPDFSAAAEPAAVLDWSRRRLHADGGRLGTMLYRPGQQVRPLAPDALERLLQSLADAELPVSVLAGNAGVAQRFTGLVRWLRLNDNAYRVHDAGFALTVTPSAIRAVEMVHRPARTGFDRSLDCRDAAGETVLSVAEPEGASRAEKAAWQRLLNALEGEAGGS